MNKKNDRPIVESDQSQLSAEDSLSESNLQTEEHIPDPTHELTPSPPVANLLSEGRSAQSAGQTDVAAQRYARAVSLSEELVDRPGYARSLAQLAALEEACGEIEHGLAHNQQAIDAFMALGDGAGLVQAYRLNGFLHLRTDAVTAAVNSFAQALALALQLDTRLVITTLNQVLPAIRYLIESDQLSALLPLGAGLQQAVKGVEAERGEWPEEMADFAELARTVAAIWPPLGLMADEPDLTADQRRSLAAQATHQAWLVDALTRRHWNLADLVSQTLKERVDFHEKLD